jgi:hypothetical protein
VDKTKSKKPVPTGEKQFRQWNDDMPFRIYELAKAGRTIPQICTELAVNRHTFLEWIKKKRGTCARPLARQAYKLGKAQAGRIKDEGSTAFREYVYDRLSEDAQEMWDEVLKVSETKNAKKQLDLMFSGNGAKRLRQELFLHAFIQFNFSASAACRAIGISLSRLEKWKDEPGFQELMRELQIHKKNFFEAALVGLVKQGDTAAIIFANKALNADRGYNPSKNVKVSGSIDHQVHDLEKLKLPLDVKRQMLKAMRQRRTSSTSAMQERMLLGKQRKAEELGQPFTG